MQPRIYCWAILATLAVLSARCSAANENTNKEQSSKDKSTGGAGYNSYGDDIYLDDQDLEGSGRGGGEVRGDLEASGSGLGPDDEDGDDEFGGHNTIEPVANKPVEPKVVEETIYKKQTTIDAVNRPDSGVEAVEPPRNDLGHSGSDGSTTYVMSEHNEEKASSLFTQPNVLLAVIGGAVVGLLCAILVVMFIVYRMRKKDEGSYALDEPRRSPAANAYPKPGAPQHNREFYA
ncbi:syndecan isoform X1 [Nasonia vitripennis]|uniref:Syndecan n=2 Tax=Nasonia vitripennis TaxID=7425 RepID=A0A7M7G739_NASVI|nr:syndecan isoform X1 [Nasonia vitripennis]